MSKPPWSVAGDDLNRFDESMEKARQYIKNIDVSMHGSDSARNSSEGQVVETELVPIYQSIRETCLQAGLTAIDTNWGLISFVWRSRYIDSVRLASITDSITESTLASVERSSEVEEMPVITLLTALSTKDSGLKYQIFVEHLAARFGRSDKDIMNKLKEMDRNGKEETIWDKKTNIFGRLFGDELRILRVYEGSFKDAAKFRAMMQNLSRRA
jgi:hypothetical protein